MFKNYLDRELSQTRKVSSLRQSLSWINKWLKWSLKKTKSSSSLMLRSTPFLTEFAPLMVLKIYKWKTNLCFFFWKTNLSQAAEVDQNRWQERGWQRNVFRMSWRKVWKKEAPSRKGGNLHKVSTASWESLRSAYPLNWTHSRILIQLQKTQSRSTHSTWCKAVMFLMRLLIARVLCDSR